MNVDSIHHDVSNSDKKKKRKKADRHKKRKSRKQDTGDPLSPRKRNRKEKKLKMEQECKEIGSNDGRDRASNAPSHSLPNNVDIQVDDSETKPVSTTDKKNKKKGNKDRKNVPGDASATRDLSITRKTVRQGTKSGSFAPEETSILWNAIKEWSEQMEISDEELQAFLTRKSGKRWGHMKRNDQNGWNVIAQCLPNRSVTAIYDHACRKFSKRNYKGSWTDDEISKLERLVAAYGHAWTKIGEELDRFPLSCRDKWRVIKSVGSQRGNWSVEEATKLRSLVNEYLDKMKKKGWNTDDKSQFSIPWGIISERHGSRGQDQCRIYWLRHEEQKSQPPNVPFWTDDSQLELCQAIRDTLAETVADVPWGIVMIGKLTAEQCRTRWAALSKRVPSASNLQHDLPALINAVEQVIKNSNNRLTNGLPILSSGSTLQI